MANKSILITGCSSGIGFAAAKTLSARGYRVFASCRKQEDVEALKNQGLKDALQLDLASSESIDEAVKNVKEATGDTLYALFNNGAYGLPGALEDVSRNALRRQFEVNVFGTHELTIKLLPMLLKQESARIIQNSSVLGFICMPNRGAYNASKHALEGLTDTLRLELRETNVKFSTIQPGPIISSFRKNALTAMEAEIDFTNSRHKLMYEKALQRLRSEGPVMPYTLGPEAVVEKLIHALESKNPKVRYRVTKPTYLMWISKRLLSSKALDFFIARVDKP